MRKTTLAISFVLGLLLLAVMVACGGESERGDSVAAPEGNGAASESRQTDGDASATNLSEFGTDSADQAVAPVQAGGVGSTGGGGTADSSGGETSPQLQSQLDRKIIRTATLSVTVEDVGGGMQEVERIANTAGGFVSASSLSVINPGSDEEERRQTGIVTIRVPSEAYASVMNQLRAISEEVVAESSDTSEVAEEYTDLESRLRTLEATEARYLELLTRAETIEDILIMEDRLNSVRFEIEQVVGRMNLLDNLSDLATITVRLDLPPVADEAVVVTSGWAEEAWNEAWATSEDALKVLGTIGIVAGVTLIWLAIPAALVVAGWRLFGQKRTDKGTT